MGKTRDEEAEKRAASAREREREQLARTEAFYNAWCKKNQGAKWRVLGQDGEPDPDSVKEATLSRGYGPNDPMSDMPKGFLRRVDAEKGDYSDLYSDGKSLTSYDRNKLAIKSTDIAADVKNQQDCWAKHGVGSIVIDNKKPNGKVLDGIMQRLEAMQTEHPPRAIQLGPNIIDFMRQNKSFIGHSDGMKNGQLSPKYEKMLQLAATSQDRYQKYLDSKVSKVEAKETAKNYSEMTEKFNDKDKSPPAPVGADNINDMVEKVLKNGADFAPVDTKGKLEKIAPEIEKLEARAQALSDAKKQLTDQIKKFDATLKDDKSKFADTNGVSIKLAKEAPQRAELLAAIEREQTQVNAMREIWQKELAKPGYPEAVARPLAKDAELPLVDKLRDKLNAVENSTKPSSDVTSVAEMRTKFHELKETAATKSEELNKGGPVPRKPR